MPANYSNLPDEILNLIFFHLCPNEILGVARVCKRFNRIANDQSIWRRFVTDFGTESDRELVAVARGKRQTRSLRSHFKTVLLKTRNWAEGNCIVRTFQAHNDPVVGVTLEKGDEDGDGHILATASQSQIGIWDVKSEVGFRNTGLFVDPTGFDEWSKHRRRMIFVKKKLFYPAKNADEDGDNVVWLYNVGSKRHVKRYTGHGTRVTCVHVAVKHPEVLVTGTEDGTLSIFNTFTGQRMRQFHPGPSIYAAEVQQADTASPLVFAGCKDGNAYVFDLRTQALVEHFDIGHGDELTGMRVVGTDIIATKEHKFAVKYDLNTRRATAWDLAGPAADLRSLAVHDTKLIAGYENGLVRVWDAHTQKLKYTLDSALACPVLYLDCSETKLITGSFSGKCHVWDFATTWRPTATDTDPSGRTILPSYGLTRDVASRIVPQVSVDESD